jgi:hypothetical protein
LLGALRCRESPEPSSEPGAARPEPVPLIRWHLADTHALSGTIARQAWVLADPKRQAAIRRCDPSESMSLTALRIQPLLLIPCTDNPWRGHVAEGILRAGGGLPYMAAAGQSPACCRP